MGSWRNGIGISFAADSKNFRVSFPAAVVYSIPSWSNIQFPSSNVAYTYWILLRADVTASAASFGKAAPGKASCHRKVIPIVVRKRAVPSEMTACHRCVTVGRSPFKNRQLSMASKKRSAYIRTRRCYNLNCLSAQNLISWCEYDTRIHYLRRHVPPNYWIFQQILCATRVQNS